MDFEKNFSLSMPKLPSKSTPLERVKSLLAVDPKKYCPNYLFTHPYRPFYYFFQRSLNPKNFSLHFNPVKLIDSGEYACIVNDKQASGFINLAVQDVPQAPERPMITGFHSRWVNLSWTHNGDPRNDPVIHFIIQSR